jgi:signal recognition particle GTPase
MALFENLTARLSRTVDTLRGRGRITEENVGESLREVRMALLEADVALPAGSRGDRQPHARAGVRWHPA